MGEKQLVVLEEIERDRDKVVGYGRTSTGTKVEFPIDDGMLFGIVRMLTLAQGASVWVPENQLKVQPASRRLPSRVASEPLTEPAPGPVPHDRRATVFLPEPFVASLVCEVLEADRYDVRVIDHPAAFDTAPEPPDVVFLDLIHPAAASGVDLLTGLIERFPKVGIVVLTRLPDARFVGAELPPNKRLAFLRLQATQSHERLLDAANAVVEKRSHRLFRDDQSPDRPLGTLSNRQLWLLGQLARGHLLSDIANTRGVSERGAQRLLSRTYARLGIAARRHGHARSLAVRRYCDAAGMVPVGVEE